MAYTSKQLTMAWTAVHNGVAPSEATVRGLEVLASSNATGAISDADILGSVLNGADDTTALAALSYQFFTGKSPSKAGFDYLLNSAANPNDLNDAYYAKFNIENRYINFAANLGVQGEGAKAFSDKYGAMSFSDYVASIYETIIGATYAKAAGVDVAAAIAYLVGAKDAVLATARGAGMITADMTPAQVDLALKAAMAGLVMAAAIKADIGIYAASANNFMLALAKGDAVYNVNLIDLYGPTSGKGSTGNGKAVDTAPTVLPGAPDPPQPPPAPTPTYFTLGVGANTLTGGVLGDVFIATSTTLHAGDVLDGGGGNDTLTITATGAYTTPAATIRSIETVNINNSTGGVIADATTWTGLERLNVTNIQATTVTAAATPNVFINNTNQGGFSLSVTGGHDVTATSTATTGAISIGAVTAPTGAVVVNRTSADLNPGAVSVTGGTSIEINLTATNPVNTTQAATLVTLTPTTQTTSVKIKAPSTVAADTSVAGHTGGSYVINDANTGSSTTLGSLKTVDVDGYATLDVGGTALTTLRLAHGDGAVTINNSGAPAGKATTLDLLLNGVTGGTISDQGGYTRLNVTSGAEASNVGLAFGAVTTLNFNGAGAGLATITNVAGMTALTSVTASGAARFSADISGLNTVTSVDTTASTGASALTIDASKTSYVGGAGTDTVTLGATSITKAISLGGGDDTLALAFGTGTPGAAINGGAGTADTLVVYADDAVTASTTGAFAAQVTGFERLVLIAGGVATVDVAQLGGYHYVISRGGLGVIVKGLVSGDTLEFQNFGTATRIDPTTFGGTNDTLNVVLTSPGSLAFSRLLGTGVEHLAVNMVEADHTLGASQWRVMNVDVQTVTLTGNGSLALTLDSRVLTSVDVSGLTGATFGWNTGALTQAATIKGSATGANTVTFSSATGGVITYEGGSGDDIIDAGNGLAGNIIHLGAGTNYLTGSGGATSTVTAGAGDDYIRLDNGGATVNAGDGANVVIVLDNTASTITTGSGDDNIFVGGGANIVNVGSGVDYVGINAATATATAYTTINGMGAGDKIEFSNLTLSQTTAGAAVADQGSYTATLTAALAGDGSATPIVRWFISGTDTYVVVDNSASATFDPNVDYVVKVTGVHDLNQAGNVSTFAVTLH